MARGPNRFKQLDVERAIKAARKTKAGTVRVLLNGAIEIDIAPAEKSETAVDEEREIVL
jgi:hypothetical protein